MIHLHFAIHNHQPVGNFDFIFERAFNQAYKPFFEVLSAHPKIRMSMHFSGILLDWLEANHPEYISAMRKSVQAGQLEILGGGFYEPILPVISDADKVGQLKKLQAAAKRLFGVTPKGIWLAERVWEPTLVKPIAEAGIEYVVLDGSHFKMVGKTEADMDGFFLSEDQGYTLKLFPIHDVIRDYIPFRPVEEVIGALLALDKPGNVQVVFGDDGEKFGDWPWTYQTVYTEKWLHRFFEAVEQHSSQIKVVPVAEGLVPEKNLGLVYLPPASYGEMMVWAQPARDIAKFRQAQKLVQDSLGQESAQFLRGTFWRNFFYKYSESNQIHKQVGRLSKLWDKVQASLSKKAAEEAKDHIWQAQCNCGYWHGVFGGLYLPHLRFALYRNLIDAQKILDKAILKTSNEGGWEMDDWNFDGKAEYSLNTKALYLSFNHKGEIDQFWLKASRVNLTDTLTRRYEAYHDFVGGKVEAGTKLENSLGEKEGNLRGHLTYDHKIRHSLSDLFLQADEKFDGYASQNYAKSFSFNVDSVAIENGKGNSTISFSGKASKTDSVDKINETDSVEFDIVKKITVDHKTSEISAEWAFKNAKTPIDFQFGCESLFCLLAGDAPDRYVEWNALPAPASAVKNKKAKIERKRDILSSRGEMLALSEPNEELGSATIVDEWLKVKSNITFTGAKKIWRDAIQTVSQSEGGYERVYQGTVLIPLWQINLDQGQSGKASLSIKFEEGA